MSLLNEFNKQWPHYAKARAASLPLIADLFDATRAGPAIASAVNMTPAAMHLGRAGDPESIMRLRVCEETSASDASLPFALEKDINTVSAQCQVVQPLRFRSRFLRNKLCAVSVYAMGLLAMRNHQESLHAVSNILTGLDECWTLGVLGAVDSFADAVEDRMISLEESKRKTAVQLSETIVRSFAEWLLTLRLPSVYHALRFNNCLDEESARRLLAQSELAEFMECNAIIAAWLQTHTTRVAAAMSMHIVERCPYFASSATQFLEVTMTQMAHSYVQFRYRQCFLLDEAMTLVDSYLTCDAPVAYSGVVPSDRPFLTRARPENCKFRVIQHDRPVPIEVAENTPLERSCWYARRVVQRLSQLTPVASVLQKRTERSDNAVEESMRLLMALLWRWLYMTHLLPAFSSRREEKRAQMVRTLDCFGDLRCPSRTIRCSEPNGLAQTLCDYAKLMFWCDLAKDEIRLMIPYCAHVLVPSFLSSESTPQPQQLGEGGKRKVSTDDGSSALFADRTRKCAARAKKLASVENEHNAGLRLRRSLVRKDEWARHHIFQMKAVPNFMLRAEQRPTAPMCPDDEDVLRALYLPPQPIDPEHCEELPALRQPPSQHLLHWDSKDAPAIARVLLSMLNKFVEPEQESGDDDDDEEDSSDTPAANRKRSLANARASKRRVAPHFVRPSQLIALLIYYFNHLQDTAPALLINGFVMYRLSTAAQQAFEQTRSRARTLAVRQDCVLYPLALRLNELERSHVENKIAARLCSATEALLHNGD